MIYKYQLIAKLPMVTLAIDCFQHSKWMPINTNQCVTTRGYSGPLFSISLYHYQAKGNWIVGQHCLLCKSVGVLAGHLCEFHTKQWGEPCSVPVGCLLHAFLQLIVCKSAVNCLKSLRAGLLSQDWQWEGAFAHTHTSFLACTSLIWLLFWLGTCVNFILNSEGSLALFLSVVCPTLFCNW
jgi:hypothetical protein